MTPALTRAGNAAVGEEKLSSPAQRPKRRRGEKANSYVQPSTLDMLAGASPASAMDGWAE